MYDITIISMFFDRNLFFKKKNGNINRTEQYYYYNILHGFVHR